MTWVDLVPPPAETLPPATALPAASGDQTQLVADQAAPRVGTTVVPGTPAPDTGTGESGRWRPTEAERRDRSTLHTRLADGAHTYQGEHERTAARASSPQPIRQEPAVGVGDSSRTRRPQPPAEAAPTELPPEEEGPRDPAVEVSDLEQQPTVSDGRDVTRGEGPLDTERGRRRFDVETPGIARDMRWARAASNDPHQGRLDLSSPAAAGSDGSGNGPAEDPGAVSRASAGRAPAVHGAEQDIPRGPVLALGTAEREYLRYLAEIGRKVNSALRFPKRLALLLEQGETVVHFVVRPDGRLEGTVRVVKSAGFDEFDAEAVRAVTRAAPFPAAGRPISVSMPIAFDNPVVR
jgi:TonB family protein